jgi:DNA repair protein RadD
VSELVLRPYQVEATDRLRAGYRAGHRAQILVAPTGAGKTAMATHIMDEARKKGTRVAFVVDRINLVDQTSAMLDAHGIDHGIIQAGHWRSRMYEPIQVCSAQTLEKRGFFPDLSLLVVDEAHCVRDVTANFIKNMPAMRVLGLTATPFTKGLAELYSNLVNVTTTDALIADGFLVPVKLYAAVAPDMAGAKVVAGEWTDKEIEKRGLSIIGDIVKEWSSKTVLHFGGPVKTICFSATVDHGAELCKQFNAAGFRFEQISYKDGNDQHRRDVIAEFRKENSGIVGLVSCEVFTKGFDVPDVLCGISARPYRKSFSSHIQQLGRVMRPAPEKTFALWLCHSGNVMRFHADAVDLFAGGVQSLDNRGLDAKARPDPSEDEKEAIKCSNCGFILPVKATVCPSCGHERKRKSVAVKEGSMILVAGKERQADGRYAFLENREDVWRQLVALALERTSDQDRARRFAQAQYMNIYGKFAHRIFEKTVPLDPCDELRRFVQHNIIRWAKGKKPQGAQPVAP